MLEYVSNSYFDVSLGDDVTGLNGQFISVSGLGIELEYETFTEGGGPARRFFVGTTAQTLVMEQGTVTGSDAFSDLIGKIKDGIPKEISGTVTLRDHTGKTQREWKIDGAMIVKYIGPSLNSNQAELAVSRIEMVYGGCT